MFFFLFFQAQALTTILLCCITIPSTTFSTKTDTILFQLTRICLLYSMPFQHFSVILIINLYKSLSANNWQIYQINIIAQLPLTFWPFRNISPTNIAESLVYSPRRVTAEKAVQGFSEYKLVDYRANKLYSGARRDADQGEHNYCRKLKQWYFPLTFAN